MSLSFSSDTGGAKYRYDCS